MSYLKEIKDYVDGFYDGPHATSKESDHGPIFLGIKNVTPDGRLDFSEIRHVSSEEFPCWTKRVVPQKDDIVFSYEATLHRYALIPEGFEGCLGRRMALIRPNKNRVVPRFLHYYMLSSAWRKEAEGSVISGATVDRIPLTKVPNFKVNIPSLNKQKIISDILGSYDDLIENNKRRIELLEESARQLYKEWFVRFRFPCHEHVKIIDGVPVGWKKKPLRKLLTLNYGKALKAEYRIPGNIPVYGSSGVVGTHNKPLVKGPGMIVGRKGNVGSIFWSHLDFFPIDTVYFVSADESNYFIYYALLHTAFISTDVAVPGLNRDFAYSKEILVPTKTLISDFEEGVAPIFKQCDVLSRYNEQLVKARDLLLPKFMSGEITV